MAFVDTPSMNHEQKRACLETLYDFYDEFIKGLPVACSRGCSICCTVNVAATSLEVEYLMDGLDEQMKRELINAFPGILSQPRFKPAHTTNEIASACLHMEGDVPEETGLHGKGKCPLLKQDLCTAYDRRPFACRAMLSRTKCAPGSQAQMGGFLLTINLALYQIIEHLDEGRLYGNMIDLMAQGLNAARGPERFPVSQPLPGFVLLPEEKGRFKGFIRRLTLQKVEALDTTLGDLLNLPAL